MGLRKGTAGIALAAALGAGGCVQARIDEGIRSQILREADVEPVHGPFGVLRKYFDGASTRSLRDVVTGLATLEPGTEIHPPHVHAEEEFMYVLSGRGTWHVDGKDIAAQPGDLMYTAPWVSHGITNTGSEPLTFCVFKWNPAGMSPADPPGAK